MAEAVSRLEKNPSQLIEILYNFIQLIITNINAMKKLYPLAILFSVFSLLTSCSSLSTQSTPKTPRVVTINSETYTESEFTSWRCYKNQLSSKVLAEVGYLNLKNDDMNGFILFDGGDAGELVTYKRAGLNHRWNWEKVNDNYKYSFVIDPEGSGSYYDFTNAERGRTIDAKETYKCRK